MRRVGEYTGSSTKIVIFIQKTTSSFPNWVARVKI